jgi:ferric-dicitrate binding protein FerR (iron transport regulator)
MDGLLVKHLLGEATREEQLHIQAWMEDSGANRQYYEHFKLIWEESKSTEAKSNVNQEEAWARFRQRTVRETLTPHTIELPRRNYPWLKLAAMLVLLIGGGWLFYAVSNQGGDLIALHSEDRVLIDTLPDGSVVTLNKHSSLSYDEDFGSDGREVVLDGEAFFNVTSDKTKPFIIKANEASVRVVGTSFNISSTEERTEVVVETGIVEVLKKEHSVKLNPDEKAIVLKDRDDPFKQKNTDALYNYYRTKEFTCNATPLWRLADVLSQAYGVDIVIADERLKELPLTATFQNESLDNILSVISETFAIRIERRNGQIFLK